jgi:hypothetical protein
VLPLVHPPADVALAHPLTQTDGLPVSPLVAAIAGALVVGLVAFVWPQGNGRSEGGSERLTASWAGSLSRSQLLTRVLAVALLALSIAAGRLGEDDELENLAPALVVGLSWPVLVLASVSLGPIWRWTDPWDGLARALSRGQDEVVPATVWPAVFIAVPWVWYLSAYADSLGPRSVGAILALYTIATVAGCLAVGRARWLATAEPFGVLLSWMALLPRGRLTKWRPPRGAEALLGVLAGGVLFGAIRRSELWGDLNTVPGAPRVAAVGVLVCCTVVAALLVQSALRPGGRPAVARAVVPALAAIIVAVAMDRNRLFTSLQLLPGLLGDPFGVGWDLFGRAGSGLNPSPLGSTGLSLVQLAVLLAGHLVGAVIAARGLTRGSRVPVTATLSMLVAGATIAIATN